MDKFSTLFNAYTGGEYDYLRIKSVDINTESKTAVVNIFVREDKYDNFDNSVIKLLRRFFGEFAKGYTFSFNFERLLVSADLVHRELVEFVTVHYPFVAANIVLDNVDVTVEGDRIHCTMYMPQSILQYANERGFAAKLEEQLSDAFIMHADVKSEVTDVLVEEDEADAAVPLNTVVPVSDVRYLCGVRSEFSRNPAMLSTVNHAVERIALCGIVGDMRCKIYEEPKENAVEDKSRRFYKYHYTFTLNDTTESIRVLFNTNDEQCPLKDVTSGQFMVRGRVFYNERTQSFNVFAKTVYTCRINLTLLAELRKPLPIPESYKYPPKAVEVIAKPVQMTLSLDGMDTGGEKHLVGSHVFLYLRSTQKDNIVPYEIAAVRTENGVPTLCYRSYVYTADVLSVAVELKASVTTAPRMADLVPDLVKFTEGASLVTLALAEVRPYLEEIAKVLRYAFACDWWDANALLKKGKETMSFVRAAKQHGVSPRSDAAEDMAYCLYELYLSEKGVG